MREDRPSSFLTGAAVPAIDPDSKQRGLSRAAVPEVVQAFVRRTTCNAGVPELLDDPAVVEQIADIFRECAR